MRRALAALLLIAALASPAAAQSSNGWFAVFYAGGANGEGVLRTTGNMAAGSSGETMSIANHLITECLERSGTPYRVFLLPDSAGGWATTMRATRPAGVADSTWFRQNGCVGWIHVVSAVGASHTLEIFNFFTDAGSNRGVQAGSPIDGWPIPGVIFSGFAANVPGASYTNGINGTSSPAHPGSSSAAWADNGDSLALGGSVVGKWHLSPASVADVTPIIYADSITGATKLAYKAWAYRSTTLYYPAVGYSDPTAIVLGLADLFRRANYTPARKLNLHMTIDHIIPEDVVRTAPSDTFFKYVEALNIRLSGATKPHANERAGQNATLQNMWRAKATRWPAYPHCHVTGIGNYGDGGSWNFSTYADTSTIRQRWNFLERAISDTLQFFPAQGYDRTIGFPGDGVHFPHLYIFAQNRYTDIRAGASDSIGRSSSLHARRKVASRPLTAVNGLGNYMRPYLYIEPVSGRPIWIHDLDSFPGGSDTTWAQVSFLGGNDITGKCLKLASWTKPLVWDQDVYWHANENLEGPDDIMAVFMRRFTYFYGRTRNIITVEPSYRPLIPRRGGTPRS